ncbi:uncharacterized protein PADG_04252 [Paracoccidioides brasiliensis Pb18]|uniref:Uncharacterized protein n=1 Tax=Paracoccidioides brasiliensis (strain Pb18) TaxID=502780 RepID=C1GAG6_PARBD|nr:uncharacterized protein PADG_04252 [Paracoccidioides brasiliensis Pb18]EEH48168.2 hypothetical protein PADG_04252 [Paracoccidioides brasiliensis Pb18]
MARHSRPAGPDNEGSKSQSNVISVLDAIAALEVSYSDSGYESSAASEDEDDDEGQLPAEHYLALAESLDITQLRQKRRYCRHIKANAAKKWSEISDSDQTVRFLYSFLSWRCDIRHGKDNRHCPGIKRKSSLETFWKWWHLVLKQETASGLSKDTIVKVEDAQVAKEKELELVGRPKKNMYIEDVAEFARVVLTTTEMTFVCGWQRIQFLLFLQLAAIIASRPSALLHLRYRDIVLTLIRDPDGGRPWLFIYLKPEFTKRFLGDKAPNEFKIPEIIFDPTLVLSPHVTLLTMLFHIKGFKSISTTGPVLDSAEKLYSVNVLEGKGEQRLLLQDEFLDKFVFCQTEPTPTGFQICLDWMLTAAVVRSRMRRAGEITGFEEVAHPHNLRYAGAKAFNNSAEEVSEALQNVMLQHADIRTFVKHYQVDVDVDVQGIVRKTGSQTALVRFACSMSASIDPNRPYKLSPEESRSLNNLPIVLARQDTVKKRKQELEDREAELERVNKVCKTAFGHLDDKALAESHPEVLEKLELFRDRAAEAGQSTAGLCNEQPVIDLERQLAGKLVDTKVMDTFGQGGFMPPEHLVFVDRVLAMPGTTLEAEYQRRINTINAGVAFCGVEEGRPSRRSTQSHGRPVPDDDDDDDISPPTKRQRRLTEDDTETVLRKAMDSVRIDPRMDSQKEQRPRVCFLCVGNPNCSLKDRIKEYATPGSLTRHFLRRHVNPPWPANGIECNVCEREVLPAKSSLLNHAETAHGTVVRGRIQETLAFQ